MRNNSVIAAVQVVWQTFALLIVYRLATQAAGIEILGIWSASVAVMALIALADAGLTEIMVREVARSLAVEDWPRVKGAYRSILWLVSGAVLLAAFVAVPAMMWLLRALASPLSDADIAVLSGGAAAAVCLTIVATGAAGVLEASGRYDLKGFAAVISSSAAVAITWVATFTLPRAAIVVGLVSAAAINLGFVMAAAGYLLRRLPGRAKSPGRRELLAMVRMGVQARIGGLASLGFDPVMRFMMLRFGGAEAAGLYEVSYRLVFQLRGVLVAATQVIVPRFTRARSQGNYDGDLIVSELTQSSIRVAICSGWLAVLLLPLVSTIMLGVIRLEVLIYGLALTLAWLANFIAVPAYFANFIEGNLRSNRRSHVLMLIIAPLAGVPGGYLLGGEGVVAAGAAAICGGALSIILSRGRVPGNAPVVLTPADRLMLITGLLSAGTVYGYALAGASGPDLLRVSVASLACYVVAVAMPAKRLVQDHLRRLST